MSAGPEGAPVRVGTCGFPEARARLFRDFSVLELQQTFYQPPHPATAARWRAEAPPGFVFTLKAWQLVTHPASSPTYRRLREPLTVRERPLAGGLRWNALTRRAWTRTLAVANALEAAAILVQTPLGFRPSPANLRRLRRFFESADRAGRRLVFEPRGEAWTDALLGPLLADLDLTPGVDPFLRPPLGRGLRYLRLHGRPAYRYRYRYTDADLEALAGLAREGPPTWLLFNNASMAEDGRRLLRLLA